MRDGSGNWGPGCQLLGAEIWPFPASRTRPVTLRAAGPSSQAITGATWSAASGSSPGLAEASPSHSVRRVRATGATALTVAPVPSELVGADAGEHGHGGLGRAVGGFGAETVQPGGGGREHHRGLDAAACLRFGAPVAADGLQQPERRGHVHVEQQAEIAVGEPQDRPGTQQAGVGHQAVQLAIAAQGGIEQGHAGPQRR